MGANVDQEERPLDRPPELPQAPTPAELARPTHPVKFLKYLLWGTFVLWVIVYSADLIERHLDWKGALQRSALPERQIDPPNSYGVFAISAGKTNALSDTQPIQSFDRNTEFLTSDQVDLERVHLHGTALSTAVLKKYRMDEVLQAIHDGTLPIEDELRNTPLDAEGVPVQTAKFRKFKGFLRVVPVTGLNPGLYRFARDNYFYVERESVYEDLVKAAPEAKTKAQWAEARLLARMALVHNAEHPELQALVHSLPSAALAEAKSALEKNRWTEAADAARFIQAAIESDESTKVTAAAILREALFDLTQSGIVHDREMGLMWSATAWEQADGKSRIFFSANRCNQLSLGGYTDWRLPTQQELLKFHSNLSSVFPIGENGLPQPLTTEGHPSLFWSIDAEGPIDIGGKKNSLLGIKSPGVRVVRVVKLSPNSMIGKLPALQVAAHFGFAGLTKALLDAGDNPNAKFDGKPVLSIACGSGDTKTVEHLLEAGAKVSIASENGENALDRALMGRSPGIVSLLLKAGAPVTHIDDLPDLLWAEAKGNAELLTALLVGGRDPNLRDQDGLTATMRAARRGNFEAVRLLLEHSADPNLTDSKGNKASQMVGRYEGADEIRKTLRDAELNVRSAPPATASTEDPDQASSGLKGLVKPTIPPSTTPQTTEKPSSADQIPTPSPVPQSEPTPKPKLSDQSGSRKKLQEARQQANSAREAARSHQTSASNALKEQLLKMGDAHMETSKTKENEGNLDSAITYANEAEKIFRQILTTVK